MVNVRLIIGDVLDALNAIEDGTVAVAVTSPPYWGRRTYTDDDREHGKGQSLDDYIAALVEVFSVVARKLDGGGVLWLNLGDTASGTGGAGGDYNRGGGYEGRSKYRQGTSGYPKGTWLDVPGRVLHALMDDGWLCRADITWEKGGLRPEDPRHTRRPGESTERVFMLTRSMAYRFDPAALALLPKGERGGTWHIRRCADKGGHAAPMPLQLAMRALSLTPPTGGIVLDPYAGAGTTMRAAALLGVDSGGVDLDPACVPLVKARLAGLATLTVNQTPTEGAA